jgi:hypothetical protein
MIPPKAKKMPLLTINRHVTARALIFGSDTDSARTREQTCLLPWSIFGVVFMKRDDDG